MEHLAIFFGGKLLKSVRRKWGLGNISLAFQRRIAIAVNRRGRSEQESFHARIARGDEQFERRIEILFVGFKDGLSTESGTDGSAAS